MVKFDERGFARASMKLSVRRGTIVFLAWFAVSRQQEKFASSPCMRIFEGGESHEPKSANRILGRRALRVLRRADCRKKTDITRKIKKQLVLIEDVPTGVCKECGTRYYSANVLKIIAENTRNRSKAKRHISVPVYSL